MDKHKLKEINTNINYKKNKSSAAGLVVINRRLSGLGNVTRARARARGNKIPPAAPVLLLFNTAMLANAIRRAARAARNPAFYPRYYQQTNQRILPGCFNLGKSLMLLFICYILVVRRELNEGVLNHVTISLCVCGRLYETKLCAFWYQPYIFLIKFGKGYFKRSDFKNCYYVASFFMVLIFNSTQRQCTVHSFKSKKV